jgi:hypothetical protein
MIIPDYQSNFFLNIGIIKVKNGMQHGKVNISDKILIEYSSIQYQNRKSIQVHRLSTFAEYRDLVPLQSLSNVTLNLRGIFLTPGIL